MKEDTARNPDETAWALARRHARNPFDRAEVLILARGFMSSPAQTVTFYQRDGREFVRIESEHDRTNIVDREATALDHARWG
jgi:hypothetical protein